jgi:hypothetical protein
LNSAKIVCPGRHLITKFVRPHGRGVRGVREELQEELGQKVYVGQDFAYVSGAVEHPRGKVEEVPCDSEGYGLHLFDLRSAIADQAPRVGLDVRFGFAGEMHFSGFPGERQVGEVIVQPRLVVRVVLEGFDDPETFAVARARHRSLLAGSLATLSDVDSLLGETAERLAGDGPPRGRIVQLDSAAETVVLRTRDAETGWPMSDYTVSARPALVAQRFGAGAFVALQVATGSLTPSRRKNLHAVKDRFTSAAERLSMIGSLIPMPVGENAEIAQAWTEVRVQEAAS